MKKDDKTIIENLDKIKENLDKLQIDATIFETDIFPRSLFGNTLSLPLP